MMPPMGTARARTFGVSRSATRMPVRASTSPASMIVDTGPMNDRSVTTMAQARPAPRRSAK
jgi:hypothetical protein